MPRPALFGAALAALLGLLSPVVPHAAAQEPPEPTGETAAAPFLERVDVEIVNLDVVVTDRRGEPVTGLTRDDFVVEVDGRPTPIENFYVVEPAPGPARAEAPASADPSAEPVPTAAAEPPADQTLHLVILFDNRRASRGQRKRVTAELAAAFEDGLEGRGRASVAYYDGGIKVHHPFTSDGAELAKAIRDMADLGAGGYSEDFELRNLLRELEAATEPEDILPSLQFYAEHQASVSARTLEALAAQVDALAGLPGRKILLYVASGLDLRPGEALLVAVRNRFAQAGARRGGLDALDRATEALDLSAGLRELTRAANAGRVALYAIGTGGVSFPTAIAPEFAGTASGGPAFGPADESIFRAAIGSGLQTMAAVTGGEALTNSDNYDLIAGRIGRDADHGYSLGIRAPDGGEPGKSYRVRVEVPGRGRLEVRHREEFVISTPAERAAEQTLAALLFGHADNALGIAPEFGATQPSEAGRDLVMLPVLVKVPFANLTLLPEGKVRRGRITIFVVAEDELGRLSEVRTVEAPIEVPAARLDQALAGVAGYRVGLTARRGPTRLAIGVRDEVGNVVSTLVVDYLVTAPADGARAAMEGPS